MRDELRMTLHAYQVSKHLFLLKVFTLFQTLYESSIAFGIRKALQAEQGKTDMENYIAKLEEEKVKCRLSSSHMKALFHPGRS